MEREFLRTARKDSSPFVRADAVGGRCTELALIRAFIVLLFIGAHCVQQRINPTAIESIDPICNSALSLSRDHQVQWTSAETMSALQQLVLLKTAKEEKPFKNVHNQPSSTGFQLTSRKGGHLDANYRSIFPMPEQQKQGIQTRVPPYRPARPNDAKTFPILPDYISSDSILSNPLSSVNRIPNPSVGSANGAFRTFTKQLPAKAQLTIFYGGTVNVYDEVSLEKAQAIMSLMENERSSKFSNSGNLRTKGPHFENLMFESTKVNDLLPRSIMAPPSPGLSVTGSATSDSPTPSMCGSNITDEISEQIIATLHKPSKTIAVPMARKASITRFLEKRKGRMTNCNPYFLDYKISKAGGIKVDIVGISNKTIGSEMALSRATEQLCCLENHPNNIHDAKLPSINLGL